MVAVKGVVYTAPVLAGGVGITYEATKETVMWKLGNDGYVDNPDDAWSNIFEKFKGKNEFETKEFKDLKTSSSTKSHGDLKDLCKEKLDTVYKSIFSEQQEILKDTKKACFSSIGEVLGTNSYGTEKGKIDHDKLKNYSDSEDPKLEKFPDLQKIQKNLKDTNKEEEAKVTHANWCRDNSGTQYLGDKDDKYKIFKEICKKKSS